jgi:hypothetical protein
VTASSLNLRDGATTAAAVLFSLPQGTRAAARSDAAPEADGFAWREIRAALGGAIVEGWVASKYLEPIGAGLAGVTHRVDASGLNFRRQPRLAGELIVELPRGTEVAATDAPGQQHDDHTWGEFRAVVDGVIEKGWLATQYLESIG